MAGGRTGAAQGALSAGKDVLRAISGQSPVPLLTYNPGPGIYSRLERAIEAMPEAVRTQELPGLLKRYKDGVPGWELKATDLDSVIAGRDVVPREELLARVKERSPVYTHGEVVLRDPEMSSAWDDLASAPAAGPSPIGRGSPEGVTGYADYSQGGKDYTEILLTQPGADGSKFGSHWRQHPEAVAHARFDVHDGYLRVNELQSDLGIHNRKSRERAASGEPPVPAGWADTGNPRSSAELPFPMEDSALEVLLKRLNLYAAQHGLKGVEIASPRAIADKVGGNIENYQHAYGKVAVGNQQRLGRKLGGMAEDVPPDFAKYDDLQRTYASSLGREEDDWRNLVDAAIDRVIPAGRGGRASHQLGPTVRDMERRFGIGGGTLPDDARDAAYRMFQVVARQHMGGGANHSQAAAEALRDAMPYLARAVEAGDDSYMATLAIRDGRQRQSPVIYRGTMSDEMRRRIIEQGIGASVLAPLLMQDGE
jgi:hypothetical protein